jgi:CRISPR/Cas system-associated exonuclease Cas4 (RecB family)
LTKIGTLYHNQYHAESYKKIKNEAKVQLSGNTSKLYIVQEARDMTSAIILCITTNIMQKVIKKIKNEAKVQLSGNTSKLYIVQEARDMTSAIIYCRKKGANS